MLARGRLNLRGLQVFEAVARHRSVTLAAIELGITQSAASHQLRRLSDRVGEDLLKRQGRGFELTPAGSRLAASLDQAFSIIEETGAAGDGNRQVVRVGTYSSFANGWLIPALSPFLSSHPELELRLVMLYDPHEVSSRIADVFITSEPTAIGYSAVRLFAEKLVPVAAMTCEGEFQTHHPLITNEVAPALAGRDWEAFWALNDWAPTERQPMICCSHYVLALEMVRQSLGIGLLPDYLIQPMIDRGELRRMPGKPLPTGQSYQVQVKQDRRQDPSISRFVSWLRAELRHAPFTRLA